MKKLKYKTARKEITAEEFDKAFEEGNVSDYLDLKTAKVRNPIHRINIDMPQEILEKVDKEAARVGVPRTSLIKIWIAEKLDHLSS